MLFVQDFNVTRRGGLCVYDIDAWCWNTVMDSV